MTNHAQEVYFSSSVAKQVVDGLSLAFVGMCFEIRIDVLDVFNPYQTLSRILKSTKG